METTHKMQWVSLSVDDLPLISQQIIEQLTSKVVLLDADMGSGKTTLVKQLVKTLGHHGETSSPTFAIINEYNGSQNSIFHWDCYRINNEEEAIEAGLLDYLDMDAHHFIEWPWNIKKLLPLHSNTISIEVDHNGYRIITLTP